MPTVEVNDITMYYEIHGKGEALVLIAGLATDITQYESIIHELSQEYQVIAFDNRGVGRTDKPDLPYSIEMMAEDTSGLMAALGVERAHILGTSLGGRIALGFTLKHPEKVQSLILVSTSARVIGLPWMGRLLFALVRIPMVRKMGTKYPQPYYAFIRQREASRSYDATDQLREIGVPTVILHGKKDRIVPYRLAEEMHDSIRGSKIITFDGGHLFSIRMQKQFLDAVVDFLKPQNAKLANSGL